jgi:hypothetical protein
LRRSAILNAFMFSTNIFNPHFHFTPGMNPVNTLYNSITFKDSLTARSKARDCHGFPLGEASQ